MDPTTQNPTTAASSTAASSCISDPPLPPTPLQLLDVSLISAQDLAPVCKSMRTYAVAWINPNRKLTTRTDLQGHTHPTWNEKFSFRVDAKSLISENSAMTVEIYTVSWFRDVLVGTVRVLISDLLAPPSGIALQNLPRSTRFIALQVRRPSGAPQGILNMGVSLLDTTMRSMPLNPNPENNFHEENQKKAGVLSLQQQLQQDEDGEEDKKELERKIQLWRSLSVGSEMNAEDFSLKPGSIIDGSIINGSVCKSSMVNGSELCSDVGPSASIVAAELAKQLYLQPPLPVKQPANQIRLERNEDTGSSILEELTIEEAKAKGYRIRTSRERWRREVSDSHTDLENGDDDSELSMTKRHSRRNSDGGLFSCLVYGIEFTIVCGASKHPSSGNKPSRRKNKPTTTDANSTN
ncbi:hypothetical protein Salat_1075800 [Sesamum alatum]|uniref:C2 domain-containing protein n=1 Tax=Sesamum alatum TaxID=300844 RepID=A0AAE1YMV5_9LAMI|nr:hypothetical protein Salat_1075800 [Sesamum alatum]